MLKISPQEHRSDIDLLRDPLTRALRQQIAGYLPVLRANAQAVKNLPSYVRDNIASLLDSLDRWEQDERNAS